MRRVIENAPKPEPRTLPGGGEAPQIDFGGGDDGSGGSIVVAWTGCDVRQSATTRTTARCSRPENHPGKHAGVFRNALQEWA